MFSQSNYLFPSVQLSTAVYVYSPKHLKNNRVESFHLYMPHVHVGMQNEVGMITSSGKLTVQ